MRSLVLLALLAAAPASGNRMWTVDREQAFVTLDADPFSAFSHRLSGALRELDGGRVQVQLRVPLRSLTTGNTRDDRALPRDGDLAFDLEGPGSARDGTFELAGTLTFQSISRPVRIRVALVRRGTALFGHARFDFHLGEFGYRVPSGMQDGARIELDTALRLEHLTAARG